MKRNRESARENRQHKKETNGRQISQKKMENRREQVNNNPLVPWNDTQKEYIQLLQEKDCVIAIGLAGTSKTYIPTKMACQDYLLGVVDTIYITRPNISNSKSLGYFGGSLVEKMSNWLLPVLSVMKETLGVGALECAIENGNIVFVPFEIIKGMSFSNAWVICDEAEDITVDEAKKFVTRLGKNVRCAMAGDIEQSELKGCSGLKKLIELTEVRPSLKAKVGVVNFDKAGDIVRSDICKEWILAFREDEKCAVK